METDSSRLKEVGHLQEIRADDTQDVLGRKEDSSRDIGTLIVTHCLEKSQGLL